MQAECRRYGGSRELIFDISMEYPKEYGGKEELYSIIQPLLYFILS